MRFKSVFSLLAIISLSGLFACDFFPGSVYKTRQTMRTWLELDATKDPLCVLVGTYTLSYDLEIPDFDLASAVKIQPEDRADRDGLPTQASLQWELNSQPFYQIDYDLNFAGRARFRLRNNAGSSLNANDVIDTWFCIPNGIIPIGTTVEWSNKMRFDKE